MKSFHRKILLTALLGLVLSVSLHSLCAQDVVINEVMATNHEAIYDEDGDSPDWIELFNSGTDSVNLSDYGLTDDSSNLSKWIFPDVTLAPQDFMLVFASGKDRRETGHKWETIVNWGDTWKYYLPTFELPVNWRLPGFDDSSWLEGPSGFGYGDDDDATLIDQTMSVYLRKTFSTEQLPGILDAMLNMDYDDGFVAYLNGTEIARANLGTPGTYPLFDEPALVVTEPLIAYGGTPASYPVDPGLILPGTNVLAIEVHNFNLTSSDLTSIPFFSLLLDSVPPDPNGSPPLLQLRDPQLHTNFRIKASGENIILSNPAGVIEDSIFTGYLATDVSYGRQPDGTSNWFYFTGSTPGLPNNVEGWPGINGPVHFSLPAGSYIGSIAVALSSDNPGDVIHYTLDGSEPGELSPVYQSPILIFQSKVIRAIPIQPGFLPALPSTASYIIGEDHDIPIISMSTAPANLFDPETGIYHENNIWQDWERPVHIEFFDTNDSSGFSLDAGIKIYGAYSRTFPQKSFAIYARESYGYGEIDYRIFPNLDIDKFEAFILRNSGNDWLVTMFRDGLMTGLVANDNVDVTAFRPAAVYINGDYWGLYNIREKINERFLESHHGINPDSVDILENNNIPAAGNADLYNNMIQFIDTHPLSDPLNYAYIKTQMDVENFISYQIAQIFVNNTDWPGNNIKYWRSQQPGGKWRWIMYDTDFGFGLVYDYTFNTLAFAADPQGPDWPNPPWSTYLFRQLLTNVSFRTDFINRYADLLNTSFRTDHMLAEIDAKKQAIINEMPLQIARWGGTFWDWLLNIIVLREFAENRRQYAQAHVLEFFGLPEYSNVTLNVQPEGAGIIGISTLEIGEFPWTGEYFNNVPVKVSTSGFPGYRFVGWEGSFVSDSSEMTVVFTQSANLTAVYEAYTPDQIVINEINYNPPDDFNSGDWIELYNPNNYPVDLTDWSLKDEDDQHVFTIPNGTLLVAYGYLVLCADTSLFSGLFPEVSNYMGNLGFGLNGAGELIRLYDFSGLLIDSVRYDDEAPWPVEPDGNGPTLELIDPSYDNALPESWLPYNVHGTPGSLNGPFTGLPSIISGDPVSLRAFPNPLINTCNIEVSLDADSYVTVEITDMFGRKINTLYDGTLPKGVNRLTWDGPQVRSSIYILILKTPGYVKTAKLIAN